MLDAYADAYAHASDQASPKTGCNRTMREQCSDAMHFRKARTNVRTYVELLTLVMHSHVEHPARKKPRFASIRSRNGFAPLAEQAVSDA